MCLYSSHMKSYRIFRKYTFFLKNFYIRCEQYTMPLKFMLSEKLKKEYIGIVSKLIWECIITYYYGCILVHIVQIHNVFLKEKTASDFLAIWIYIYMLLIWFASFYNYSYLDRISSVREHVYILILKCMQWLHTLLK